MKRKIISKEDEVKICYLYQEEQKSSGEISIILKCSKTWIIKILRKNNIPIRSALNCHTKNKYDKNYFNIIDTEEKAYFLGFMYADGHNAISGISISLQSQDSYILERFKTSIKHSYPLYNIKFKDSKRQNQVKLQITSKSIAQQLHNLGCIAKKSLILKFPTVEQVPEHLIQHFIRGYFDGDGCVSFTVCNSKFHKNGKRRQGQVNFCGSHDFIFILREFLTTIIKITSTLSKIDKVSRISFGGVKKLFLIYDFLYKNAEIFLHRKKDVFEKFFKDFCVDLKTGIKTDKTSQYQGVYKDSYIKKDGTHKWQSCFYHDNQSIFLGRFNTEIEAALAYDKKALEVLGKLADLNFPE